jgi:ATP-dependent protease ClpP protease subunit
MNKRQREILARLQPAVDLRLGAIATNVHGKESPLATRPRREVPGLAMHKRPSADAPAELMIYGRIGGGGWFDEGIGAADVAALLREAGPGPVNVRINSGGGDVFDGVAIHSLLARHAGTVTVYVDGLAASAASFIMLAGDRIVSARNAFIMIHDAMTMTYGNGDTHREAGEMLDKVSANIADMYAERAGEDVEHWRNLMTVNGEDGTWYTGQEALDAGLVDELTAVKDEDGNDEDYAVAQRLAGWSNVLPTAAREFISDHPTEDDDPEPDEEPAPDVDPVVTIDEGEDFQHAMAMAHWLNTNGRTATKESA